MLVLLLVKAVVVLVALVGTNHHPRRRRHLPLLQPQVLQLNHNNRLLRASKLSLLLNITLLSPLFLLLQLTQRPLLE
jgi:hypothetical protein